MITFFAPTYKDVIEQFEETNNNLKNSIDKEVTILENLQNELENFEKTLIEKDSLSWKELKDLEDILKKQNELENKLEEFKKSTQNNFEKLNSEYEPSEKILKKQKEIEKLIEFCGLEWDENCLNPHKNKSAIKTASINQARRPIYQSSIDTNQYYSKYLKTLFSLLKK